MKNKIYLIFALIIISTQVNSQKKEVNIKGQVIDSLSQSELEFAQINLFKTFDTTLFAKTFTDINGRFEFEKVAFDNYFIQVTYIGFKPIIIQDIKVNEEITTIDFNTISLSTPQVEKLEAVQIIGRQDVLQNGIDKKIFNVDQDLSSRGSSATEVLSNIPSVDVDQNGNVSLRGDANVTILIDGRLSSLSGGNGKSLLETIPASTIERIEVVSNPSAKYSPDGTSGIINIVLKKNKLRGTNFLISSSVANGFLFNGSLSASFRNDKMNLFSTYSNQYRNGFRNYNGDLTRNVGSDSLSKLSQNRTGMDLNKSNTIRLGGDFYLKENHTLGVSWTLNQSTRERIGNLENRIYNDQNSLESLWQRNSSDPDNQLSMDISSSYKIDFKKQKGTLIFDGNISTGKEDFEGEYEELYFNTDGTKSSIQNLNQQITNKENNSNTTLQLDYTKELAKINARLEMGSKVILRTLNVASNSSEQDTISQLFIDNNLSKFSYTYNEQVYAFYSTFGQKIGKLNYQAGLRAEQAYQIPYLKSENLKFTNDYFKLYPSIHIKFIPKEKQELSISYSKRINRPSPGNMNPFSNLSDPFNLRKGNPALKPEFIDSYDLGYSIQKNKLSFTTSIYYRYTQDVIQRIREYYNDNTSAVIFSNISESQSIGLEIILGYKPFSWLRNTLSLNGNTIRYKDDVIQIQQATGNQLNLGVKYMGAFDFWKKTMTAQININYFAPRVVPQGIVQRKGGIDISIEKHLKDKWVIGSKVTDIFNTQSFLLDIQQETITQIAQYKWLTRRVYLNITYKFGKLESSRDKSNGEGGGMDF